MFIITYDIGGVTGKWHDELIFDDYSDARDYLINKKFVNVNGVYEKNFDGWFPDTKAYINKMKGLILKSK